MSKIKSMARSYNVVAGQELQCGGQTWTETLKAELNDVKYVERLRIALRVPRYIPCNGQRNLGVGYTLIMQDLLWGNVLDNN